VEPGDLLDRRDTAPDRFDDVASGYRLRDFGVSGGSSVAERERGGGQAGGCFTGEPVMSKDGFIIEAQGIHKTYRMGAAQVQVLKGADVAVKKGEFVAIVGASGSGKSTLLHILGALDRPDKGAVLFEERDLSGMSGGELNEYRNKMIGFVFQFYHLLDELNVLENVILPAMVPAGIVGWMSKRVDVKKRGLELLKAVGLEERAKHKPYQLSGGERQRAAIARALVNEPRLLLADEPTGNLDSATGNGILELLEKLNRAGQTIVMVTHDERVARRAGRTITLADGRVK
jgi:lipoprotein-releasing system ATP-binding protein